MATTGTYYFDAASFANATTVYTDQDLTNIAANGWYSDQTIVREQISGVLFAGQSCAAPTPTPTPVPAAPTPTPVPTPTPTAPSPPTPTAPTPVPAAPTPAPTAPTPTPTAPTPVPVPVPVPVPTTPTPVPSAPGSYDLFLCTGGGANLRVVDDGNISTGMVIKYAGVCYTVDYYTSYTGNFSSYDEFGDCAECLAS